MTSLTEIKSPVNITEVWAALGGAKLCGNRGQAFWRGGYGYSVALDPEKGVWFDHRDGVGGDVIALVEHVRQCGFLEAAEWLAAHTGVRVSSWIRRRDKSHGDWASDLERATWWRFAAEALAEETLEKLPSTSPPASRADHAVANDQAR